MLLNHLVNCAVFSLVACVRDAFDVEGKSSRDNGTFSVLHDSSALLNRLGVYEQHRTNTARFDVEATQAMNKDADGKTITAYYIGDCHGEMSILVMSLLATGKFEPAFAKGEEPDPVKAFHRSPLTELLKWKVDKDTDDTELPGKWKIFIVGDFMDRGRHEPAMYALIRHLCRDETYGTRLEFLLGNHESLMLRGHFLFAMARPSGWPATRRKKAYHYFHPEESKAVCLMQDPCCTRNNFRETKKHKGLMTGCAGSCEFTGEEIAMMSNIISQSEGQVEDVVSRSSMSPECDEKGRALKASGVWQDIEKDPEEMAEHESANKAFDLGRFKSTNEELTGEDLMNFEFLMNCRVVSKYGHLVASHAGVFGGIAHWYNAMYSDAERDSDPERDKFDGIVKTMNDEAKEFYKAGGDLDGSGPVGGGGPYKLCLIDPKNLSGGSKICPGGDKLKQTRKSTPTLTVPPLPLILEDGGPDSDGCKPHGRTRDLQYRGTAVETAFGSVIGAADDKLPLPCGALWNKDIGKGIGQTDKSLATFKETCMSLQTTGEKMGIKGLVVAHTTHPYLFDMCFKYGTSVFTTDVHDNTENPEMLKANEVRYMEVGFPVLTAAESAAIEQTSQDLRATYHEAETKEDEDKKEEEDEKGDEKDVIDPPSEDLSQAQKRQIATEELDAILSRRKAEEIQRKLDEHAEDTLKRPERSSQNFPQALKVKMNKEGIVSKEACVWFSRKSRCGNEILKVHVYDEEKSMTL